MAKQQVKVGDMVVAYRPAYFSFIKCVKATLLLCQLEYWQYRKDDWFWKTHNELTKEIGLTRNELDRARGRLLERSLIQHDVRGLPGRSHYQVLLPNLYAAWSSTVQMPISSHPHFAKGCGLSVYKQQQALLKSNNHLALKILPESSKEITACTHADYEEPKAAGEIKSMNGDAQKFKPSLEQNPPDIATAEEAAAIYAELGIEIPHFLDKSFAKPSKS